MAINKATLAKTIDGAIHYIYPKTDGNIVIYDETHSVNDMIKSLKENKVEKIEGKGLSSNDFTNEDKDKLDKIKKQVTDSVLSLISENPVQNKVITKVINDIKDALGEYDKTLLDNKSIAEILTILMQAYKPDNGPTIVEKIAFLLEKKENEHVISEYTITATGWEGKKYAKLEVMYPSSKYNIFIDKGINITEEQNDAFVSANISGAMDRNVLTALGDVPTIDIPVIIEVVHKSKRYNNE